MAAKRSYAPKGAPKGADFCLRERHLEPAGKDEMPMTRLLSCASLGVRSACDSDFGLSERQLILAAQLHGHPEREAEEEEPCAAATPGAATVQDAGEAAGRPAKPQVDARKALRHMDSIGLLDLSRQQLHQLPTALGDREGVQVALISENRLTSFQAPNSWLATLLVLDLSANQLTAFPNLAGCRSLRCLALTSNRLTAVGPAGAVCPQLAELRLAGNRLSGLRGLHEFPNLVRLDLAANRITGLGPLRPLAAQSGLRALALAGNPVVVLRGLPALLANLLPQLQACDVPGLTCGVHRYRRCGTPAFFCAEWYRKEVERHPAAFSHIAFLSTLTGGLGADPEGAGPGAIAAARPASATPSPRRRRSRRPSSVAAAGTTQCPTDPAELVQARPFGQAVAACEPLHDHKDALLERLHHALPQSAAGTCMGTAAARSSASWHTRRPSAWSTALDDMTCTSLRQRLQGLNEHGKCHGSATSALSPAGASTEPDEAAHARLLSRHASSDAESIEYESFVQDNDTDTERETADAEDPALDSAEPLATPFGHLSAHCLVPSSLQRLGGQQDESCEAEAFSPCSLQPEALTPRFRPDFFQGEAEVTPQGNKELCFQVARTQMRRRVRCGAVWDGSGNPCKCVNPS
mmetsp:Transcript_17766/g.54954  ORF Transcript_17766/g.54954 Transcript_17766/m.54954 type:complete len:637 (+) Transcript_17766:92-2002(+)